jgi:hypothetical protein
LARARRLTLFAIRNEYIQSGLNALTLALLGQAPDADGIPYSWRIK